MYLFHAPTWDGAPQGRHINAASNTAGPGLLRKVPRLRTCYYRVISSLQDYGNPREPHLICTVAAAVNAPEETIVTTGSTLREIERLCTMFQVSAVICLQGDFPGYARGCALQGIQQIELCVVDAEPGDTGKPQEDLARAASRYDRPIVYVTAAVTNPLQTSVDAAAVVSSVRSANPDAIVLIDTAYAEFCGYEQSDFTPLALQNDNVIVLAPASKILFHAGIAAGWMIIGDKQLRAKVLGMAFPYPMPGIGTHLLPRLLQAKRTMAEARREVCKARDTLIEGIAALWSSRDIVIGHGPWVLINAGEDAERLVGDLRQNGILVQRQTGIGSALAPNWVRISATVSDEAEVIVRALQEYRTR